MLSKLINFYEKLQKKGQNDAFAIDRNRLYEYYLMRPLSVPFTLVMYGLGMSANLASYVGGILLITASILLILDGNIFLILGLYNLYFVFDHVDGNLARLYKKTNRFGKYLDGLISYIFEQVFIFCLGIYYFNYSGDLTGIVLSFGSIFLFTNSAWMRQRLVIDSHNSGYIETVGTKDNQDKKNGSLFKEVYHVIERYRPVIIFPVFTVLFLFNELLLFLIVLFIYDLLINIPIFLKTFFEAKKTLATKKLPW